MYTVSSDVACVFPACLVLLLHLIPTLMLQCLCDPVIPKHDITADQSCASCDILGGSSTMSPYQENQQYSKMTNDMLKEPSYSNRFACPLHQ